LLKEQQFKEQQLKEQQPKEQQPKEQQPKEQQLSKGQRLIKELELSRKQTTIHMEHKKL